MIDIDFIKRIRQIKFEEHLSNAEIAQKLDIDVSLVKRVTRKSYDAILNRKEAKENKNQELTELVKKCLPLSNSINHLCNILGLKGVNYYYKKINKIISENNLSTEHFGSINLHSLHCGRNKNTAMSDNEFFISGVERHGSNTIKRLIKGGYKEYSCECCGISKWNGKPLTLQLHHLNGDHYDNRLENLQILCPNCHAQTNNYSNKGNRRKFSTITKEKLNTKLEDLNKIIIESNANKPTFCQYCGKEITTHGKKYCSRECANNASKKFETSAEQLIEDFKKLKSYTGVGKKYGVSDNAIKKRCKRLGIYDEISTYIIHR